jgi:hypothetical protein
MSASGNGDGAVVLSGGVRAEGPAMGATVRA